MDRLVDLLDRIAILLPSVLLGAALWFAARALI